MYKVFKVLQTAAEQIGAVANVAVNDHAKYFSDGVEISGTTAEGKKFTLKYEEEDADE